MNILVVPKAVTYTVHPTLSPCAVLAVVIILRLLAFVNFFRYHHFLFFVLSVCGDISRCPRFYEDGDTSKYTLFLCCSVSCIVHYHVVVGPVYRASIDISFFVLYLRLR